MLPLGGQGNIGALSAREHLKLMIVMWHSQGKSLDQIYELTCCKFGKMVFHIQGVYVLDELCKVLVMLVH